MNSDILIVARCNPSSPQKRYKKAIQTAANEYMGKHHLLIGLLEVHIIVYFYKSRKTNLPDIDNMLKVPLDACTNTVWKEDSQIVKITAERRWETDEISPRVEIRVSKV